MLYIDTELKAIHRPTDAVFVHGGKINLPEFLNLIQNPKVPEF